MERYIEEFKNLPAGASMKAQLEFHQATEARNFFAELEMFGTYELLKNEASVRDTIIRKLSCTHHIVEKMDINAIIAEKCIPQGAD